MPEFHNIPHPLVRDGRSQEQRSIAALMPDYVKVDERSQEDILNFLFKYAEQLLLYQEQNGVVNVRDWQFFFSHSTPIQIALISKFDTHGLQCDYENLAAKLLQDTNEEYLAPVIDRVYESALKINTWYTNLRDDFGFKNKIANAIEVNLQRQLKEFFALQNAVRAKHSSYREILTSTPFIQNKKWQFNPIDLSSIDSNYLSVKGNQRDQFIALKNILDVIFENFLNVIRQIVKDAPQYYEKSLADFDDNSPHLGLMIAFLRLFELVQGDLNQMTRRHLDFFYRDILQLKEKTIIPDQAHLVFKIAPHLDDFLISKSLLFSGGKDAADADLLYELEEDLVIDKAQVASLKTLHLLPCIVEEDKTIGQKEKRFVESVHVAPIANSADGLGEDFVKGFRPSWKTLGGKESKFLAEDSTTIYQDHPEAIIGFVLAAPSLFLKGGTRDITVKMDIDISVLIDEGINIDDFLGQVNYNNSNSSTPIFTPMLSGEEDWFEPSKKWSIIFESTADSQIRRLVFKICLTSEDPPILKTNNLVYPSLGADNQAAIQFLFNNRIFDEGEKSCRSFYDLFRRMPISNICIQAEVTDFRDVKIENDAGVLDPTKPFQPFGALPKIGSGFYLSSEELSGKDLYKLVFEVDWDLPKDSDGDVIGFSTYYQNYLSTAGNEYGEFKASVEFLNHEKNPVNVDNFNPADDLFLLTGDLDIFDNDLEPTCDNPTQISFPVDGCVKIKLLNSFLHEEYSAALTRKILELENEPPPDDDFLPNPPYVPVISSFKVAYTTISKKTDIQFVHLFPFEKTYLKKEVDTGLTILPDHIDEGSLFIGLKDLKPRSIVSLLFQMVDSTANPDLDKADVRWSYLSSNEWVDLIPDTDILFDQTNGLINSGIVKIQLPGNIYKNNTILPSDLHWLKVSTLKNAAAVVETIMVHTQAAKVIFQNNNNDLTRLSNPLPAGTISEPAETVSAIGAVLQPYDSFGGRAAEPTDRFDTRISEHLRHKGRAITLYDYERLILEAFPEIYKVKCIPHTLGQKKKSSDYHLSPGFVTITVVPDVSKLTYAGKLQPKATLSTLTKIEQFLKTKTSPFVRLKVLNPIYEAFDVKFKVKFKEGKSPDFYKKELAVAVQEFLAPWAFGEKSRISFGGTVFGSAILNFIEQQDYVDYITDFVLREKDSTIEQNELTGTSARSILVLNGLPKIDIITGCSATGIVNNDVFVIG